MSEPFAPPRRHWLPIETNLFDRIFIGVVVGIALHLFWMRFLEAHLSLYLATGLSVFIGWAIARHG